MTKATAEKLNWVSLDTAALSTATQGLMTKASDLYKAYKAAKEAAEKAIIAESPVPVPEGKMIRFSYRYGASVAIADKEEKKAKNGRKSLAELLKETSFVSETRLIKAVA